MVSKTEFQFCKWKSSGDWLHNNVNILNTPERYSFKKSQNIYVVYFTILEIVSWCLVPRTQLQ